MTDREWVNWNKQNTTNTCGRELPSNNKPAAGIAANNLIQLFEAAPASLSAGEIIQLQRVIGNRATCQLMKTTAPPLSERISPTHNPQSAAPFVQSQSCQSNVSGIKQPQIIQRKLRIATNPKNPKDIHRLTVYQEQLNELYKLGSSERQDLVFQGPTADKTYQYTEAQTPKKPNHSWSADLLGAIISNPNTTTIFPDSPSNEAFPTNDNAHDQGQESDMVVKIKDGSNTLELAHELIHVSHFNEKPHWDQKTRKDAYSWSNPEGGEVSVPDGREEARTVGLGEYDLDKRTGKYMGVTENDLRYIMGIKKRESYGDTSFEAETEVGREYVSENQRRWTKFSADTHGMKDVELEVPVDSSHKQEELVAKALEEDKKAVPSTLTFQIDRKKLIGMAVVDQSKLDSFSKDIINSKDINAAYSFLFVKLGKKGTSKEEFIKQLLPAQAVKQL